MNKLLFVCLLFVLIAVPAASQRYVIVTPEIDDELARVISTDSSARNAALPTPTIYLLKRNGYYPVASKIENTNYFLHIKAEPGTGYRPLLAPIPTSGTTYAYAINFRASGKLEGLTLEAVQPTGGVRNRYINVYNGASLFVDDCEVVHDRGSAFAILSDSCSIYITNSFIHSVGHPKTLGGNGRLVDLRPTALVMDTILIQNTTYFNVTDRIIRNMNTVVNYLKFDHNTGLGTQGYHGGLQAGRTKNLIITNNIFYNTIMYGSHYNRVLGGAISEQTQPEKSDMYVVTLDTAYTSSGSVVVRNNNMFWSNEINAIWAKYPDTTKAPKTVTSTINKALVDSTKAWFEEKLTFQAMPPDIYNFIDSALAFPNATVLPENWSYEYQDSLGTSPVNGSYGTTATSYTAADGGYPLGDLNWYPTLKTRWLQGLPAAVEYIAGIVPSSPTLARNYPNPFNPSTSIRFTVPSRGNIVLAVYDVLGRLVKTLVNEEREAGEHTVTLNAGSMTSGVYYYTLTAHGEQITKPMVLLK